MSSSSGHVAAYYFPNYHVDPRNEAAHGRGWSEWELVKQARPRFEGHVQPRVPLWGYEDEADPTAFARKIDAAADHGLSSFIFDWYWYNDGAYLQRALEKGYLQAPNRERLSFALMWANHDWVDIHPAKAGGNHPLLYPGMVTPATFEAMGDYIVETYFRQRGYWQIDGAPYFSIYELYRLIQGLGGLEPTRRALEGLRQKTRKAGFKDLHLNAVVWGVQILPGETAIKNPNELLQALGFSSITSYVWIHHMPLPQFPATPYQDALEQARRYWEEARSQFSLPYHPNVTMGWDSSPRTVSSDVFENRGYPFMATLEGNSPERFAHALSHCRDFLLTMPAQERYCTINAWNEWTEGSYLEPDTTHGLAYLEAIHRVFGAAKKQS